MLNPYAAVVSRGTWSAVTLTLLCAASVVAEESAPHISYAQHQLALPEGGQLAYHVREGDGPTLVLIPGSWGDYHVFDHVAPALLPELRLVITELRGHGGSWPPAANASIELFAEDVLRVVDALGLERFYVGGHSIGGMIPIEIAKRRPGAVAGVIAMEGWTHYRVEQEAFGHLPPLPLQPDHAREREASRARGRARLSDAQIADFASAWKKWDGYPILETTPVPVLELWGDRGAGAQPRERLRLPERPNIQLVWIEHASHAMLVERPRQVAAAINAFIKTTEAAPAALPPSAAPCTIESK